MATSAEEEILVLKEKNKTLAEKAQYWKMTAAQREEEKMDLMRELNQLRMALSHYRTSNSALDVALDSAVQEFSEQALTRLVEVSSSITRTVEFMKNFIHKKQEMDRSSTIGKPSLQDSPSSDRRSKVLRVVPMIRGRSIGKPIILLRPIDAEIRDLRQEPRDDTNQNEDTPSPPQHVMQDVYIPLRRIDAETLTSANTQRRSQSYQPLDDESDTNADAGSPELRLGASDNTSDEDNEDGDQNEDLISDGEDTSNNRRNLETLLEVTENEKWSPIVMLQRSDLSKSRRSHSDDPLEGPSWLLDRQPQPARLPSELETSTSSARRLEADSTTDNGVSANITPIEPIAYSSPNILAQGSASSESPAAAVFTPTRRARRQRRSRVSLALIDEGWSASPVLAGNNVTVRRSRKNDKDPTKAVVMVAKMRADELENHHRHSNQHPENAKHCKSSSKRPECTTHSSNSSQDLESATHSRRSSRHPEIPTHSRSSNLEIATHSGISSRHQESGTLSSSSQHPESATHSRSSSQYSESASRSTSSSQDLKNAAHSKSSSQHSECATHSRSEAQHRTPQRRHIKVPSFDAPSPNGSTRDAGPIVMDSPDIIPTTKQEASREGSLVLQHPAPRAVKRERACSFETSLDQLLRARRTRTHSDRARSEEPNQERHKTKRRKKSQDRNISGGSQSMEDISGRSGSDHSEANRPASCEMGDHSIRPQRPRKGPQTYKEKPLNRKLRRQD